MFEKLMASLKDPKVLKTLGIVIGSAVAIGATAALFHDHNEENQALVDEALEGFVDDAMSAE